MEFITVWFKHMVVKREKLTNMMQLLVKVDLRVKGEGKISLVK